MCKVRSYTQIHTIVHRYKKTPGIAAWCHLAFRFCGLSSSNFAGTYRIDGLPCGRFQPTAHPRMIIPYRRSRLSGSEFRNKFFVLRCTAEKSSYLPRLAQGQQTTTSLDLRYGLRLHSPICFDHVPTSRVAGWNDFLRGFASPISPGGRTPGSRLFQRFTARQSLFWHRPGYEFPGVHGCPLGEGASEHSQSHFRFHLRRDYRCLQTFGQEVYLTAAEGFSTTRMRQEQRFFGLPRPFCGA